MTLESIHYSRGSLRVLNQLKLPFDTVFEDVRTIEEGFESIRSMKVRGAPAIAIVAALSLAVDLIARRDRFKTAKDAADWICKSLEYLEESRPTAVNLHDARMRLTRLIQDVARNTDDVNCILDAYLKAAELMLKADVQDNQNIGRHGMEWILQNKPFQDKIKVLTHCNTGSLATAGYGTALGIIRSLHIGGYLEHVFCTETRPYNQGSRLTAYELVHDNIPATLITDSMAAALIAEKGVSAIIVGADRVAANGDTANKIGTFQLAIVAKYFGISFIVAAPTTSIDLKTRCGKDIKIEERKPQELTNVNGVVVESDTDGLKLTADTREIRVAAENIGVWNPAFDVTPASLISAIITEIGVINLRNLDGTLDVERFLESASS